MSWLSTLLGRKRIGPGLRAGATRGVFGFVDSVSGLGAQGWLLDAARPTEAQEVLARLDGVQVGQAVCRYYRPDISDLMGRAVQCSFSLFWDVAALAELSRKLPENGRCRLEFFGPGRRPLACRTTEVEAQTLHRWIQARQAQPLAQMPEQGGVQDDDPVRLIAFYLPQFHPIPENDEWWGAGFTEWHHVFRAQPYFPGHYQPRAPGELGAYDLRDPAAREVQARLAQEYGLHGFCYYYYWFAGRRLLERPLNEVFQSGSPDFPFCICWANESWSRRWDGSEHEVLVQQVHDERSDEAFIRDVIPLFKDPRYLRVNGAPLLLVYRLSLLPDPAATAAAWRHICAEQGIPKIHLSMVESFSLQFSPCYGFDSAVQFPPHQTSALGRNAEIAELDPGFTGAVYDMSDVVLDQLAQDFPPYKRFPGVMPAWDNTPRKKLAGNVFNNATPELYEAWLGHAMRSARSQLPTGERLVFINAWNEWGEGAYLEPDQRNGRAFLEATSRAFMAWSGAPLAAAGR